MAASNESESIVDIEQAHIAASASITRRPLIGDLTIQLTPKRLITNPEVFIPERERSERWVAAATFVLSVLYLCLFRRYMWVDPDEGIILQGAQRILDGQVLYRDFFSFFTPGSYYFLAAVFRIFGNSYLVAHTALAFVGAGFSPITYLLARRVCSRQPSLLVTGLMTITALPLRFAVLHNWDSTLLACIAVYCAVRMLETPNAKWACAAASFVSLTILFEQSKGAGLLLGLGAGFLMIVMRDRTRPVIGRSEVTAFAIGLAWPLAVTLIYFASQHAIAAMFSDWFWPMRHYSAANRVPYGYGNLTDEAQHKIFQSGPWLVRCLTIFIFSPTFWLPVLPLLAVALLIRLLLRGRERMTVQDWRYYVLVTSSIGGLLLSIASVREDYIHVAYLQPIFLLVLAWLLDGRGIRSKRVAQVAPIAGFCLIMCLMAMGLALLLRTRGDHTLVTRRGMVTTQIQDEVADYVQSHVPAGEQILIYPYESTYYYLTHTYSPSLYEYYQPGMHTQQQLEEMLEDVSRVRPRLVLYDPSFVDHARVSWPNTPASAFAYDPLEDYILREYRRCTTLHSAVSWNFQVMVRKDLRCY